MSETSRPARLRRAQEARAAQRLVVDILLRDAEDLSERLARKCAEMAEAEECLEALEAEERRLLRERPGLNRMGIMKEGGGAS